MKFSFALFGKSYKNKTDIELLELLEKGDSKAFNVLFYRYADMLALSALRYLKDSYDSKEVVMVSFEKLRLHPEPTSIKKLTSWLFAVCRNECLMILRNKNSVTIDEEIEFSEETADSSDVPQQIRELQLAMDRELSREQARCLRAFYLEEMTYKEIADSENRSIKWVKSMLQNGKRKLQLAQSKRMQP